jgi:hypothetical protein
MPDYSLITVFILTPLIFRYHLPLNSPSVWCRSNQQAQADLQLLRQEINDFVRSVLANPENRGKSLAARSAALFFKGTVLRDFLLQIFLMNHLPQSPRK